MAGTFCFGDYAFSPLQNGQIDKTVSFGCFHH